MSQYQRIENVLVDRQRLAAHELQDACRPLYVALLAIACDQALVSDPIGLNTLGFDLGQEIGRCKLMFILQIDTQKCIIMRDVHGHIERIEGLPDLLNQGSAHLGQLFGHQIATATDHQQRLRTCRRAMRANLVENFLKIPPGYAARATCILIQTSYLLVQTDFSFGSCSIAGEATVRERGKSKKITHISIKI